jgi:hypothetical protein
MPEKDFLKAFRYDLAGKTVSESPLISSVKPPPGMPGGFSSISANGNKDGIIWTSYPLGNGQWVNVQGRLVAMDATTFATTGVLWSDDDSFAKFNSPTIADGKVFRGTFGNQVIVYGLLRSIGAHQGAGVGQRCESIDQKYTSFGAEGSTLGVPISEETALADAAIGRYRHYRKSLHGGHNTLSVSVHGEHPTCEKPELGETTEVESSIYWSPRTCARVVQGDIRKLWLEMGAEKSNLGFPVSDETITADGLGRMSRFEHGQIWWYPDKGAYVYRGAPAQLKRNPAQ